MTRALDFHGVHFEAVCWVILEFVSKSEFKVHVLTKVRYSGLL
jgi:hypothetical protein